MKNISKLLFLLSCIFFLSACSKKDPVFVVDPDEQAISFTIVPFNSSILKTTSQQYAAIQLDQNGKLSDISDKVTWQSNDNTIASIDSSGVATGINEGDAEISATLGNMQQTVSLNVHNKNVLSLIVSPPTGITLVGLSKPFAAELLFSDFTTQDVTANALWSSSDEAVGTIDSNGLAFAVTAGQSQITANFQSVTATAELDVLAGTPTELVIQPGNSSIQTGTEINYQGLIKIDDAGAIHIIDVTEDLLWATDNDSVASISNNTGRRGVAKGISAGDIEVFATLSIDGISLTASAKLAVTAVTLTDLQVSPSRADVIKGVYGRLYATAYFSDGSSADVTESAAWLSADPEIVKVGNATFLPGYAYAVEVGDTNLTATFLGQSVTVPISINAATLERIDVSPINEHAFVGINVQYAAIGVYSDGQKYDLTKLVSWSASDANVAIFDGVMTGYIHAIGAGNAEITASFDGLQGKANLAVEAAPIINQLIITPADGAVYLGGGVFFQATLHYADGSTENVSYPSFWFSSDTDVLSFAGGGAYTGQSLGSTVGVGVTTITANYSDNSTVPATQYSATTTFTVTDEIIIDLEITPKDTYSMAGQVVQFTASAELSNGGATQDATLNSTWSSSDTAIASVNKYGQVHSLQAGTAVIKAVNGQLSSETNITVVAQNDLNSLLVNCYSTSVAVDSTLQCQAIAGFSNGQSFDVSEMVVWSSSDDSFLVIDQYLEKSGLVHGIKMGGAEITVSFSNITSTPVAIAVTP